MNTRDLDNYITGHYGEDFFEDERDVRPSCSTCGCPLNETEQHLVACVRCDADFWCDDSGVQLCFECRI